MTAGASEDVSPIATLVRERGWFVTILVVFLGGLALNLTPCVYPMIAITVSYFGGQGGERNARRAFVSSLIYCLGIVLTYSTLGLIAALTGSLFGSVLQSPVVLVGIALLLVALALSMFGLYELQPPQFLMQKATGLSSKAGYIGVFLSRRCDRRDCRPLPRAVRRRLVGLCWPERESLAWLVDVLCAGAGLGASVRRARDVFRIADAPAEVWHVDGLGEAGLWRGAVRGGGVDYQPAVVERRHADGRRNHRGAVLRHEISSKPPPSIARS